MYCAPEVRHICLLQANGATPLFAASSNGHAEAMRALLGAGAVVNQARVSGYGTAVEGGVICV